MIASGALESRERPQTDIKTALLVLLISKQVEFLSEIPKGWVHCLHIDMQPNEDWLEARFMRQTLETLIGSLARLGREPIDICAVKNAEVYSIVVRTSAPVEKQAA